MANIVWRCDTERMFWCEVQRDSVIATGADAATFLQSQLSQDLRPLQPGSSVWSFVLTPTGKVESLVRVLRRDETTFVLDTDAGFGDALVAHRDRHVLAAIGQVGVEYEQIEHGAGQRRKPCQCNPVGTVAGVQRARSPIGMKSRASC